MLPAELQSAAFCLTITLALLAIGALVYASSLRQNSGLPSGKIIASDTGTWFPQSGPLFDPDLQLTGKPDYLVEQADGIIVPVEVKSSKAPPEPHESHILQLAAYCVLVDSVYGVRPTHGILQYKDKAYAVDFTPEIEEDLLDIIAEMREDMFAEDVPRDHQDWRRCAKCGFRSVCEDRLG